MAPEKTSLWIAKLSPSGKKIMHQFLMYLNTQKPFSKEKNLVLSDLDIEALGVIFSRLKLQKAIDEINRAIKLFNDTYQIKILLISN